MISNQYNIILHKEDTLTAISQDLFELPIFHSLLCLICGEVCYVPVIAVCKHSFCKSCLLKYLGDDSLKLCPLRDSHLDKNLPLNCKMMAVIHKNHVKCSKYGKGCKWKGKVNELKNHVEWECLETRIKCNVKECDQYIQRKNYKFHTLNCELRNIMMKVKKNLCSKNIELQEAHFTQKLVFNKTPSMTKINRRYLKADN